MPYRTKKTNPLLVFLILICIITSLVFFIFQSLSDKRPLEFYNTSSESSIQKQPSFLLLVKDNGVVSDAMVSNQKVLYVAINADGSNKNDIALHFCKLAASSGADIVQVKILAAATANFEDGAITGTEIGKCDCR